MALKVTSIKMQNNITLQKLNLSLHDEDIKSQQT